MANIFGKAKSRREIEALTGNVSQICSLERSVLNEGRSADIKTIEVNTGTGLRFKVLEDKALDIYNLSYKGVNLNFVSKPGLVSSAYYSPIGMEFLKSFQGGFLYTCGLTNVGKENMEEDLIYPFHGRIANTPAEKVRATSYWQGDEYMMEIEGEVREAFLFKENLILKRKISTSLGSDSFLIEDVVTNIGFKETQHMILYHMNMGYPLLDENTKLYIPSKNSKFFKQQENVEEDEYSSFSTPTDGDDEKVICHEVDSDEKGNTCIVVYNPDISVGVAFEYNVNQMGYLTQWKSMASGDYALGIEPGNCYPEGRESARKNGNAQYIKPGEEKSYKIKVTIFESKKDIFKFLK